MKIESLQLENVKRIKAVSIVPTKDGLTIIGGKNGQGKTSVLDAIAWALGGDKYRPSEPHRAGSVVPPSLKIKMDNGIVVERSGKNSALKVTDSTGRKAGQQLLNEFISQLAIDLPKFLNATTKEKANILLQILGIGGDLLDLEREESDLYNRRLSIGQIADQKLKYAREMEEYPDAPRELLSVSDLIKQQQAILAKNGENQRKRAHEKEIQFEFDNVCNEIVRVQAQLDTLWGKQTELKEALELARLDAKDLEDIATDEIERNIEDIEKINTMVRANLDKERAEEEAKEYQSQYDALTDSIEKVRADKIKLLNSAELPLPGLTVEKGELLYNGFKWDNMSGSEQLKVATAIVRKLKPECGFVLLDKLEQMDMESLEEFGKWLEGEGLQAIATRVSTGGECSVIIEDGYSVAEENSATAPDGFNPEITNLIKENENKFANKTWKAGEF